MKKKPQLHEILAVEPDLLSTMRTIIKETVKVFKEKAALFQEGVKTYNAVAEDDPENGYQDRQTMMSTVSEKLNYFSTHVVKAFNITGEKELANSEAKGAVELHGEISPALPATFLLTLENRLKEIRPVFEAIPTLQQGVDWKLDPSFRKKGVYKTVNSVETTRTRKIVKPLILAPATDKHPAQVEKISEDVVVGITKTDVWSGMLTPAEKADMLDRFSEVERKIKAARMRANTQEVEAIEIGKFLMNYIVRG